MAYTFRFNAVENLSQVGKRMQSAFLSAGNAASSLGKRADDVGGRIGRMNSRLIQFARDAAGKARRLGSDFAAGVREGWQAGGGSNIFRSIESDFGNSIRRIGGKIKGFITPLNAIIALAGGAGIGAMARQAIGFVDRLSEGDEVISRITGGHRGLLDAQQATYDLSRKTGISYTMLHSTLQDTLPIFDGNVEAASRMSEIAAALSVANPAKGFGGAMQGLKNIEGARAMFATEYGIRLMSDKKAAAVAKKEARSIREVLLENVQKELDRLYGGGKDGVSVLLDVRPKTFAGQLERMTNTFQRILVRVLPPIVNKLTSMMIRLADWSERNEQAIEKWIRGAVDAAYNFARALKWVVDNALVPVGLWIVRNREWLGSLVTTVGIGVAAYYAISTAVQVFRVAVSGAITVIMNLKKGFMALSAVMMANPIAWVAAGILALGAAVVWAWNRFEGFRGFLVGMKEVFFEYGRVLYERAIKPMIALGKVLIGAFTFDKSLFMEGINEQIESLKTLTDKSKSVGIRLGSAWATGYARGAKSDLKLDPVGYLKSFVGDKIKGLVGQKSLFGDDKAGSKMSLPKVKPFGIDASLGAGASDGGGSSSSSVKHVTINIGSLINALTFNTNAVTESKDRIRQELERLLIDVVNDVNYSR